MNYNIYDDTDLGNDSNPYNNNCNSNHGENYDFNSSYGRGRLPVNYMELPYRIDRMEEIIHDMYKKGKKNTRKNKKRHNKNKKLKKHLKKIEKQNAYIAGYLVAAMAQVQSTDDTGKFGWLKKGFENSAPQIIDLISNVVASKRNTLTPTLNQPIGLPDKNRTK